MDDHKTKVSPEQMSEAEEMYLLSVLRLAQNPERDPVPMGQLASALAVQPVSANQMVHTLEEAGLLSYQPYKGILLSASGLQAAERILRYRRLWSLFLSQYLELAAEEADALACHFEHHTEEYVAERLAAFLGEPDEAHKPIKSGIPLSEMTVGTSAQVANLNADLTTIQFLMASGCTPGADINLLGRGPGGDVLLSTAIGAIHLAEEPAIAITVVPSTNLP